MGKRKTAAETAQTLRQQLQAAFQEKLTQTEAKLALTGERTALQHELDVTARLRNQLIDIGGGLLARTPRSGTEPPIERVAHRADRNTVIACIGDAHLGKRALEHRLGEGLGCDETTFYDCISSLRRSYLSLDDRIGFRPDRIVLAILGDIVDGSTMRPGHGVRTDLTIGEQLPIACDELTHLAIDLAGAYRQVDIIYDLGNHGRNAARIDDTTTDDNYETLLAQMLARALKGVPNVRVFPPEREWHFYRIGAKSFFSLHAHRAKAFANPGAGVGKYVETLARNVLGSLPDYILSAHFHQSYQYDWGGGRRIFGNGSFPVDDDYIVQNLGKAAGPAQWLLVTDHTQGVWYQEELLADQRRTIRTEPLELLA